MAKGAFVYIDHSNLSSSIKELGFRNIDYAGLFNWLKSKQGAERVYIYAGYSDADSKAELKKLEKHGYIVDLKKVQQYPDEYEEHRLKCPGCGQKHLHKIRRSGRRKANCDAELTLGVISDGVRKKYGSIIVFSGDGDFSRVYEYVAETLVKPVTVYAPMGERGGARTSTKIKSLHKKGIIRLNALEGIMGYKGYGVK